MYPFVRLAAGPVDVGLILLPRTLLALGSQGRMQRMHWPLLVHGQVDRQEVVEFHVCAVLLGCVDTQNLGASS